MKQWRENMNIDIENKEQLEKWKTDAKNSSFFGYCLKDFDRDALLSVIGCQVEEGRKDHASHQKHVDILNLCRNKAMRPNLLQHVQ